LKLECTGAGRPLPSCTSYLAGSCVDNTGLSFPQGIALDSSGNIYVTNIGPGVHAGPYSVTVCAPGSSGNATPIAIIVGQSNNQCTARYTPYSCCVGAGTGTCIDNTGLDQPRGIALDASRNIYVANLDGDITVYPSGSNGNAAPIPGPDSGLYSPFGIAVGP